MRSVVFTFFLFCAAIAFGQPPTNGLVAYYPFDGNSLDEGPNNYNAINNGPTLVEDRFGRLNNAYFFDGIDDSFRVSDRPNLRFGNTSFTMSLWVQFDTLSNPITQAFLSKRSGDGNQGYLLQLIGNQHPFGLNPASANMITSGGQDPLITSTAPLVRNDWNHLVYCYDINTNQGTFYINNILDATRTMVPLSMVASNDLFFGYDNATGGFHFQGKMDDIRFYNRKLNTTEITSLFEEDPTVAANEILKDSDISISPNPVRDNFLIKIADVVPSSMKIMDLTGKIMADLPFSQEVDCSAFPSSIYVISFYSRNGFLLGSKKFVKTR